MAVTDILYLSRLFVLQKYQEDIEVNRKRILGNADDIDTNFMEEE